MDYPKHMIRNSIRLFFKRDGRVREEKIDISIIIPIKDEAGTIKRLKNGINKVMKQQPWRWECIWVDDGSTDQSLSILKELCKKNPHHHYLSFEKSAGQSASLWAGFKESKGILLATLDGDSQNDPADIPRLVNYLHSQGADIVNGYRCKGAEPLIRKIASKIQYRFRSWITTGYAVRDVGCSTRVFKRECIGSLPLFAGMHRFFPTLVAMQGYRLIEVPVTYRRHLGGKRNYSDNKGLWATIADIFGVLWLKKRSFHYKIIQKS